LTQYTVTNDTEHTADYYYLVYHTG